MSDTQAAHHPAFPPPLSADAALWRYMDVGKFEWLVSYGRLYMPNMAQFPDRLEGTTPAGHARWWQEQLGAASGEARRTMARNQAFLEQTAAQWRDHYYVSCWHANAEENPRMWAEYTTTPEAVAIRTSYRILRASLPSFVELGLVRYIDYRSADLPSMNILQRITHKDLRFAYEQELRAVAMPPVIPELGQAEFEASFFESEANPDVLVYAPRIEPHRLIEAVVLHPHATDAFAERIRLLCASHNLAAPRVSEQ